MKTRKLVRIALTVSVPRDMSAADARREVRTLISNQSNYSAEPDDVKARSVAPAARKVSVTRSPSCHMRF